MQNIAQIVEHAIAQAIVAADTMIKENPDTWYPCGFAHVNIKPARGPLIKYLKENNIGHSDSYYGGYSISNPSNNHTQWMDAKYAGAIAFAKVLKEHGYNCTAHERID